MRFYDVVNEVLTLLQREGRLSYRALKREFTLDDDFVEDLKAELIDAKRVAVDEDGKVLVWIGEGRKGEKEKGRKGATPVVSSQSPTPHPKPPISYTPPHLAERIRAATLTEGERKTITALFADLKGSTALREKRCQEPL